MHPGRVFAASDPEDAAPQEALSFISRHMLLFTQSESVVFNL